MKKLAKRSKVDHEAVHGEEAEPKRKAKAKFEHSRRDVCESIEDAIDGIDNLDLHELSPHELETILSELAADLRTITFDLKAKK